MSDKYVRINVAVKPPKDISDKAIKISKSLSEKSKAYFVLDGKNYYPHLTIYSPEFPKKSLDKILDQIEAITSGTKTFGCRLLDLHTHDGYIDVEAELSSQFKKLHETIIEKLNPLREGHLREKYTVEENLMKLKLAQRENIQAYGYPDAMELYRPHLTLIRLEDPDEAKKLTKEIGWDIYELIVDTIAAFTMSSHGTCTGVIKEFKLQQ